MCDINIITTSSDFYSQLPATSIYPAFVDNMPYQAWTMEGSTDYYQLVATGGKEPYTWFLVSGSLPAGLSLCSNGRISGVPLEEGKYDFKVKAVDIHGMMCEKVLSMEAYPYRSKWFKDARFGFFIQWGPFCHPAVKKREEIRDFEARMNKFNAEEWAQEIKDRGGRVLNFTVMGGDTIRLWPSVTPSRDELKIGRDIVGELINACHARNIKFVAYLPGHGGWNGLFDVSAIDGTSATLHLGLINELIEKGTDGIWIDSGGSIGRKDWFDWDRVVPLVRSKNPFATIESNPAPGSCGKILQYPNTDIVTYEGIVSDTDEFLTVCIPNTTEKKMAIDVANMLEYNWAWLSDSPRSIKSARSIIKNIQGNWYNGGTFMFNITPHTNGTFIADEEKVVVNEVTDWVKANLEWCDTPIASLDDNIEYTSQQVVELFAETNASTYYTTDGSLPTTRSNLYIEPITINTSTRLRAVAVKNGKGNSGILDKSYIIILSNNNSRSLLKKYVSLVDKKHEDTSLYTGMKISVGKDPIRIDSVGRCYMDGNISAHTIKIVRLSDLYPVLVTKIEMDKGKIENDGYKYKRVAPVVLDAYTHYYILSTEDSRDYSLNINLSSAETSSAVRILRPVWTDISGTVYHIDKNNDLYGNLINFKYEIIGESEKTKNLARGKEAFLQDNEGNMVNASCGINVAENALDGKLGTMAVAGDEKWAWTLHVDLGDIMASINKVVVKFAEDLYPTEYMIMMSSDEDNWIIADTTNNCNGGSRTSIFKPLNVRFVRIRSLKPDGPNQTGGQMAIVELEVYAQ
ncbi:MAG: hypothetical protein A2Y21_05465 [Clostridiales bacterium GWC2_40_7]|nr:MAG: hypothetical protein A2Y21_05465 [Clostridiales bacterium GWC2_40_7]